MAYRDMEYDDMEYRELGRTGLTVSAVGMGCEGFEGKTQEESGKLMGAAMDAGICFFDMYTPSPAVRRAMGQALRAYPRERFVIQGHLCTDWQNGQYVRTRKIEDVRRSFEHLLTDTGFGYIDIGMIHYCDTLDDLKSILTGDVMAYAKALKGQGVLRCIGLSTHNPDVVMQAVASGEIDVIMMSVNPAYDMLPASEDVDILFEQKTYDRVYAGIDPKREAMYRACQQNGVALTVMKPFAGGLLLSPEQSPFGKAMTPVQCISYCLDRPAVAAVMGGMATMEEVKQAAAYHTATPEEKDYSLILSQAPRASFQGHCMYCGHCAPCPAGIDIAKVNQFYDLSVAQGSVPETVKDHYDRLGKGAGDCIGCGACEGRCPFQVAVREKMKEAARLFGR